MIWYGCPAVACVPQETAQRGVLVKPLAPHKEIWSAFSNFKFSIWTYVCVCHLYTYVPLGGDKPQFGLQMNFNLTEWSFVSCSDCFGCGVCVFFFSPSGRCVVVGGSCRMAEHSLLSDSPSSWRLCYPMSLFTDNVFISICFMCKQGGWVDALTALSEKMTAPVVSLSAGRENLMGHSQVISFELPVLHHKK